MLTAALLTLALQADSLTRDLGTIRAEDGAVSTTFVLTNDGTDSLTITSVKTSCSCTRATFTPRSIASGDTAHVTVTYNPGKRLGVIDEQVIVYGAEPLLHLKLTGKVVTDDPFPHLTMQLGTSLKVARKEVKVNDLKNGQMRRVALPCGNISGRPVKVSAIMLPAHVKLSSTPSPIPPGAEADIIFTIDGTRAPHGKSHATVMLMGLDGRPSDCIVTLNIIKQ